MSVSFSVIFSDPKKYFPMSHQCLKLTSIDLLFVLLLCVIYIGALI